MSDPLPVPAAGNTSKRIKRIIQPADYAAFMDHGYRGLYGGLEMRDIHARKRLKPGEHVLDHVGGTEWPASFLRCLPCGR